MRPVSRGLVLLLAAFMVAGCVGATVDAPDSTPKAIRGRAVAPAAMAAYLHNLSEPDAAIRVANGVLTNFKIGGSDGVKLDAWIVRPKSEGKYPLVLEVTPYYSGGSPIPPQGLGSHAFGRIADILVPRGYAYGIMSVRGTGNSEGCFTVMGAAEGKTTAAAIEALAKQPWSNGNVGLVGVSYPGTTPQDAWVEAPPALKTIIPISGISDLYKYSYVNGVHINQQGYAWTNGYSVRAGTLQYPTSWAASMPFTDPLGLPGTVVGEACPEIVPFHAGAGQTAVTANKDAFWTERDLVKELKKVGEKPRPSVFYIHGLQDWNVKPHMMEDWLAALQESGVPLKIWLGQWQHAWPAGQTCSTGPCRADWWEGALVAWLD
ncbi:MAG TPA: CocE/NonD family hydrolase, partial [Candidatus Thermoplasmatota archaeon]|nr:CocE/NonD family hydrolase [Candidatus Thermoplasmatota archaeon]